MKVLMKNVIVVAGVLGLTLLANADFKDGKPDPTKLRSGTINCDLLEYDNLSVQYVTVDGKGSMFVLKKGSVEFEREIFLQRSTRCSSYGGGCFYALDDAARVGDQLKYFVDHAGDVYNSTSFNSVDFTDGDKAILKDTNDYPSKLRLGVGFEGAPSPFDQPGIVKMVCTGSVVRDQK